MYPKTMPRTRAAIAPGPRILTFERGRTFIPFENRKGGRGISSLLIEPQKVHATRNMAVRYLMIRCGEKADSLAKKESMSQAVEKKVVEGRRKISRTLFHLLKSMHKHAVRTSFLSYPFADVENSDSCSRLGPGGLKNLNSQWRWGRVWFHSSCGSLRSSPQKWTNQARPWLILRKYNFLRRFPYWQRNRLKISSLTEFVAWKPSQVWWSSREDPQSTPREWLVAPAFEASKSTRMTLL